MSTTSDGREAESSVAEYLKDSGHKIISLNWRTRYCEIDIVSTLKKTVYFTEVKFRSSPQWGGGLEYITSKKLKQMKFAAELWLTNNNWKGDALLQGAEVDSDGNINLVELL